MEIKHSKTIHSIETVEELKKLAQHYFVVVTDDHTASFIQFEKNNGDHCIGLHWPYSMGVFYVTLEDLFRDYQVHALTREELGQLVYKN